MLNTRFPRWRGDIGNAASFEFPVLHQTVAPAEVKKIVTHSKPDQHLVDSFVESGLMLVDQGATVIGTSCGFMASVQNEIATRLPVPFLSSSLILLPLIKSLLGGDAAIGILTFSRERLDACHFPAAVSVDDPSLTITGLDPASHWFRCINENLVEADKEQARKEVLELAKKCVEDNPDIAALLLECTNLSPWKAEIQAACHRPVFDLVSALEWLYRSSRI